MNLLVVIVSSKRLEKLKNQLILMLTDLTQNDFEFWRKYALDMQSTHDKEFMQLIQPDLIRAFYRGRKEKDERFSRMGALDKEKHTLLFNSLFSTANTILPNLYYQNPSPIITPLRDATDESAAILTALIKYYMKVNDTKRENQEAVLNAFWFGMGWKKISYNQVLGTAPMIEGEPESQVQPIPPKPKPSTPFNFMDLISPNPEPNPLQSKPRMEFTQSEGLVNSSESPINIMVDHKSDLANSKVILHRIPRTLYELMNFPAYDQATMDEMFNKFRHVRGTRFETRDIDLTLFEMHIMQRNGIWILSWVDTFNKPLQYEKSTLEGKGFQFVPLTLTNEPGVRYPTSHMKIAIQTQDKIDKMASTFYEQISRRIDVTLINKHDLSQGQVDAIEQNKIHGIILTDKPVNMGTFAHVQSPSVQNDLPLLIQMCQQSLIEVMGSDQQMVQGRSKNTTLGQDELARQGTKIRESGMQDRVRDFLIKQIEKEIKLLQTYSEAELRLQINPEDYSNPVQASQSQPQQINFMTQNPPSPVSAKSKIQGEYSNDVNIEEALKPDREAIRQGIERIIATYGNPLIRQELNNKGVILSVDLLWKEWLRTFEILGNPTKYLEQIDSMQLAAMQTRDLLMNSGGNAPANLASPKLPVESKPKAEMNGKIPKEAEPVMAGV